MIDKKVYFMIAMLGFTFLLLLGLAIGIPLSQKKDNYKVARSILNDNPLIDGHNDLSYMIRENFRNQLDLFDLDNMKIYNLNGTNNVTHTDFIRLREGKLGGQFWAIYADCNTTGKDATRVHLEQIDLIKRLIQKYPKVFEFVTTSEELVKAHANKKIASLLGMESGHAIDSSLALLRIFYSLGIRYMTLTHNCNVPWATNNLVDKLANASAYGGLTDFGKLVIKEMNRLGMIVDLSHVSTQTMDDALDISKAPVMFSHSSVYQLCNHTRNVKDHILDKLKKNNGVIMINFYNGFLTCSENASLDSAIEHIEYVKKRIGVDHIGIGADYDGVDMTPTDLEDVSKYPNLFAKLLDLGWSEADLIKIAGQNIIRVLRDVEKYSQSVQADSPINTIIYQSDLKKNDENYTDCRTSF